MKRLMRSALPTLLTLAIIAALLWYGDVPRVVAIVARFRRIYLLWFLLVTLAHEVVRGLLWHYLLEALSIRVPLRTQVFAFAAGEAAKFLPTGAYLQNYFLQRSTGTDFGRSSAATTVMIVAEIAAALLIILALGAGAWSIWLQLAIVSGVAALLLLATAYLAMRHVLRIPRWLRQRKLLDRAIEEFRRFRAGAAALAHPRIMAVTLLLVTLYVLLAGAGLYLVVRALGVNGVSFWQAEVVNAFGLAFYVVLGSLEAADVGALIGIGVSKSAAVSAVLVNRGLSLGITTVLAIVVMAMLPDEWQAVRRPQSRTTPAGATTAMTAETTIPQGSAC